MKIIILISFVLAPLRISAADILTVDNNPGSVAMFDNIEDAYDAAPKNAIILIAGSSQSYTSATTGATLQCFKPVHFVGPGYQLSNNLIPGLNTETAKLSIRFKNDISGGNSSGASATGIVGGIVVEEGADDISIDKCMATNNWDFYGKVSVARCFAGNSRIRLFAAESTISNTIANQLWSDVEDTLIDHCAVMQIIGVSTSTSVSNTLFFFESPGNLDPEGNYTHCLNIGADIFSGGIGNVLEGKLLGDVLTDNFKVMGNDQDRFYLLNDDPENPALGGGLGGVDIGPFGGDAPYVLGGVPGIPRLTSLSVPSKATGLEPLNFSLEARAFED